MIDRRLSYSQFRDAINIMSKDREWAIHAYYCRFELFRPPDWEQCALGVPAERSIWEHETHIRQELAMGESIGLLEYFSEENDWEISCEDDVDDEALPWLHSGTWRSIERLNVMFDDMDWESSI